MLVGAWEVEGRGEGVRGGFVGPGLLRKVAFFVLSVRAWRRFFRGFGNSVGVTVGYHCCERFAS
jgi:hypothetical protein